jgi:D-amino peptidase
LKLYILTDIEGTAGVANFHDYSYETGRFYTMSRHLLTQEVNAAVEGALEAGATDIVVWDGHGPGGINVDEIHPEVRLLHGTGIPTTLGIDASFDALFFVGQHAMSNTPGAGLAHSYSSKTIENIYLNGERIGEFGIRTILAGCFDVPVVLVTGDSATKAEAVRYVPLIEAVVVKESVSIGAALTLAPAKARTLIREGAARAIRRRGAIPPFRLDPPYELVIEFKAPEHAEGQVRQPGWTQLDDRRAVKRSDNFLDIVM